MESWSAGGDIMANSAVAGHPDAIDYSFVCSVTVDDFKFTGFRDLQVGGPGVVQPYCAAFDKSIPGLNGLGLSAAVFQFGPRSQIDPHLHPCATEMFYVLSGQVEVGFVDTNNEKFVTTLQTGDVFIFPQGLLHWQRNRSMEAASGFSVLSSDKPDALSVAKALFTSGGSGLPNSVLATAFGTNQWEIETLKQAIADRNPSLTS